jgi:hypothetical protein
LERCGAMVVSCCNPVVRHETGRASGSYELRNCQTQDRSMHFIPHVC